MKTRVHRLQTKRRTCRVEIVETPSAIRVGLSFSQTGKLDDGAEVAAWLASVVMPLGQDPRPILILETRHS